MWIFRFPQTDLLHRKNGLHICLFYRLLSQGTICTLAFFADFLLQRYPIRNILYRNLCSHLQRMYLWLDKYICKMCLISHLHVNLTIHPAKSHVIYGISERRNIQIFPAVDTHRKYIVLPIFQVFCKFHKKCRITAMVRFHFCPIDINNRIMRHALKGQFHTFPLPRFRRHKMSAISTQHLIRMLIKVMIRKLFAGMRQPHILHLIFRIYCLFHGFFPCFGKFPVIVPIQPLHASLCSPFVLPFRSNSIHQNPDNLLQCLRISNFILQQDIALEKLL